MFLPLSHFVCLDQVGTLVHFYICWIIFGYVNKALKILFQTLFSTCPNMKTPFSRHTPSKSIPFNGGPKKPLRQVGGPPRGNPYPSWCAKRPRWRHTRQTANFLHSVPPSGEGDQTFAGVAQPPTGQLVQSAAVIILKASTWTTAANTIFRVRQYITIFIR